MTTYTGPLQDVARAIELAVAPVFLLTAIGGLINVLSNQLARITGQELHLVDTSSATVRSYFDLVPGPGSSSPGQLKAVNGGWVMTVSDGAGPATLYFSDNL